MKIRLMSDLHTEFRLPYKQLPLSDYCGEDVLVLAGDIASGSTNTIAVLKFFKAQGYKHVVYVPGNHEYYGTSIYDFDNKMRQKCWAEEGIHFLNCDSVEIDGVLFVGATLWTNFRDNIFSMKAAGRAIADFHYIKGFSPEMPQFSTNDAAKLFYKHWEYIRDAYEQRNGRKVVVVTHFLPALECISPRFWNPADLLNDYFASDLGNYIADMEDTVWMFGHTHDPIDKVIGNTRIVCNPHGYWTAQDEGEDFDPYKLIEV